MMRAVIFGAPGSGKGTYSTRLQDRLGVEVISMGDIFRKMMIEKGILGRIIKRYVDPGLLVPDPIVIEVLADTIGRLSNGKGFILDGFPRTLAQAEALENITPIDVIIQLKVPDWIIVERLSARRICSNCGAAYNLRYMKPKMEGVCDRCGGPLYRRADDSPDVIKMRLDVYKNETRSILRFYQSKCVPSVKHTTDKLDVPPDKVVDHILTELRKLNLA